MKNINALTIQAYSSGNTLVNDQADELKLAQGLGFDTLYPGGLYGAAEFYVPRPVARSWQVKGAQRVVFRNGMKIVYEGKLINLFSDVQEAEQGVLLTAAGYWGSVLGTRRWRKRWADRRFDQDVWAYQTGTTGAGDQSCTIDRLNRIRFTPKGVAWANGDYAAVRFTMPTGETVKRITANYDLQEGAQAWEIAIRNVGTATDILSVTATGTGSWDNTLATPSQSIEFRFYARAAQTPVEDGTYYGQISSVVVYGETGSINLTEIAKDIGGNTGGRTNGVLSVDETLIGSNTFDLEVGGFVADDWGETLADMLMRAASFGDTASPVNPWAVGVRGSDMSSDGLPILFAEAYPAVSDYDYIVSLKDCAPPFKIGLDYDNIWNWIVVAYTDAEGNAQFYTPDDDATLKDATSITDNGQRDYVLNAGRCSQANALNLGKRFLAARKDPQYRMSGPITVKEFIETKAGDVVPACQVVAGRRLKVPDFLNDVSGVYSTGLTFLITGTHYDDEAHTVAMNAGVSDNLSFLLAVMAARGY